MKKYLLTILPLLMMTVESRAQDFPGREFQKEMSHEKIILTRLDGSVYEKYAGSSYWVEVNRSGDDSFRKIALRPKPPVDIEYTRLDGKIYFSKAGGNWVLSDGQSKTEQSLPQIMPSPAETKVLSIAPNPTTGRTTIRYFIADDSFVSIQLLSPRGEVVLPLMSEMKKSGYYELQFNTEELQSGVYMYQLKVRETVITGTISVIK